MEAVHAVRVAGEVKRLLRGVQADLGFEGGVWTTDNG